MFTEHEELEVQPCEYLAPNGQNNVNPPLANSHFMFLRCACTDHAAITCTAGYLPTGYLINVIVSHAPFPVADQQIT